MKLFDSNKRYATTLSDAVDEAIIMYETEDQETAVKLLHELGFDDEDIDRIFKHPEKRRKYINDMLEGY